MISHTKPVPIEDVLSTAGCGWYTYAVVLTGGLNLFASAYNIMILAYVMPATDCDLNLTTKEKGFLTSMTFSGMILTTYFFGFVSDEKGRREVAMKCNFLACVLSFMAAFAPGYISLSIILFLVGVVNAGVPTPTFVFVSECVPMKVRTLLISITGAIGNLPTFCLPALALIMIPLDFKWDLFGYLTFTSWRLMLLTAGVPSLVSSILFLNLHESPKYLLSKGRDEEALNALRCMYAVNNWCSKNDFQIHSVCLDDDDSETTSDAKTGFLKKMWLQTTSLFHKPLLRFTVISCIVQAGVVGASNSIVLWLPQIITHLRNYDKENPDSPATFCQIVNIQTDTAFNTSVVANEKVTYDVLEGTCDLQVPVDTYYLTLLVGATQFVMFCTSGKLAQTFGSQRPLVVLITFSATMALIMMHVKIVWVLVLLDAAIVLALTSGIPILVGLTVEYFPTSVRSTANCFCITCARLLSSVGAQIMGASLKNFCEISYYCFSAFCMALAVFALMLPKKEKKEHSKP